MSKFESCGLARSPGSFLAACKKKKKKKKKTIMRDKSTGSPFLYVCKWRDFGYKQACAARPGRTRDTYRRFHFRSNEEFRKETGKR